MSVFDKYLDEAKDLAGEAGGGGFHTVQHGALEALNASAE